MKKNAISNAQSHQSLPRTAWHALAVEDALAKLESDRGGLKESEAQTRLKKYGPNRLKPPRRRGPLMRFLLQFHNVLIYVLLAAAGITALLGHWIDTGVILAVVIINSVIGFIQEGKAEQALEAIRKMLSLEATVIREGKRQAINAEQLVPGDVVLLRSGDKVPADIRLIEMRELRIDEAMLTGESVPAEKDIEPLEEKASLGDRHCIAYSGTLVTSGQGLGVVVETGNSTEIGRISEMVSETQEITTPLIRQMDTFGRFLSLVIVAVAGLAFVFGTFIAGQKMIDMFLAAVALAVAAIPEGLPAIMTIVLAIGVRRMAARNAIIRRLPAVDTLGALTVICSDKTGTLTRNEMTVTQVVTAAGACAVQGVGYQPEGRLERDGREVSGKDDSELRELALAGFLCNDADLRERDGQWTPEGDPMEGALITLGLKTGLDVEAERKTWPTLDTIPFESKNRFMATLHRREGQEDGIIFVKGAPEKLLDMCATQRRDDKDEPLDAARWRKAAEELASQGRRVLAAAVRPADPRQQTLDFNQLQSGLTLLGLYGIIDPPREEAIRAVKTCHEAGIRVVMITGDHALTARAIGKQLGIGDGETAMTGIELDQLDEKVLLETAKKVDVFARVSPEHKLRLVQALQSLGHVAAMTGDGVNDAPALKRADVGIAMGIKGTEVSKEAAEMVLTDDNFASIAHAIEEGRTVYDNLRKSILFILPTNGGEGLTILAAILLSRSLPLTPVQVLWVNMITAVTLALALAFEPPESDVMKRAPRSPKSNLLTPYFLWRITFVSVILWVGTFGAFLLMRARGEGLSGADDEANLLMARTVAVNTLVMFEAFYLLNCRFIMNPVLRMKDLLGSRFVLMAIALVVGFQMLFTYAPVMQKLFGTTAIGIREWILILAISISVYVLVEIEKAVMRWRFREFVR